VIEDVAGFKLDVPRKGAADEGTKALKAGSYVVYCDIPGHREAGMEATLRVA
jgi:plastocyanin